MMLNEFEPKMSFGRVELRGPDCRELQSAMQQQFGTSDLRRHQPHRCLDYHQLPLEHRIWPADSGFLPRRTGRVRVASDSENLSSIFAVVRKLAGKLGRRGMCGLRLLSAGRPSVYISVQRDKGEYSCSIAAVDDFPFGEETGRDSFWKKWLPRLGLDQVVELYGLDQGFGIRPRDERLRVSTRFGTALAGEITCNPTQIFVHGLKGWPILWETVSNVVNSGLNAARSVELCFGVPAAEFASAVPYLNSSCPGWNYGVWHNYSRDPFEFPSDLDRSKTYRCPVLVKEHQTLYEPQLQVDVLHTPNGSFLELMSCDSRQYLEKVADKVGIELEFWEGRPEERWGEYPAR